MAADQPLAAVSEALHAFLNQRLLPGLAELRQNHSHSDLLLPPDIALPALTPLAKTFAAEHQLDQPVPAVTAAADTPEREQQELERRRIGSIRDAAGHLLRTFVLERPGPSSSGAQQSAHLDHAEFKALFDRLDIALAFELAGAVESVAPLSTIEAVLDSLPLSGCARLMDYVESRKVELLSNGGNPLSPTRGKGPILLRLGNELRRRLSKPSMSHTILAGRIAALLSAAFELGERSGSNQEGRFNIDNRTIVEDEPEGKDAGSAEQNPGEDKVKDEEEEGADEEEGEADEKIQGKRRKDTRSLEERATPDDRFYSLFWHMQRFFANPALLFEAEENVIPAHLIEDLEDPAPEPGATDSLKHFRVGITRIFDLFAAVNEHEAFLAGVAEKELEGYGQQAAKSSESMDVDSEGADSTGSFFPKYLTGRRILASEVRDASFRRQVLVQFLILLQYILEFNPRRRAVWSKGARNNALNKPWVLTEAQVEWCSTAWKSAQRLLRDIPDSEAYALAVTETLRREHNWAEWKLDLCPKIQKDPMTEADLQPFAQAMQRLGNKAPAYPHDSMGTFALKQLWEDGVTPPKPGKRIRENEEGIEVEVETDGLEDLERPPQGLTFDDYTRKWKQLEEEADRRRAELGLPQGASRREASVRRAAERAALDEQRSSILTIKAKRLGAEAEIREHKKSEPAEDAAEEDKAAWQATLSELEAKHAELENRIPSKAAQMSKQSIMQAAQKELEENKAAAAKERQDPELSKILEKQHSHSWRALRLASRQNLWAMCRIPADDLGLLQRTTSGDFDPDNLVAPELLKDLEPPKGEANGHLSVPETPAAATTPAEAAEGKQEDAADEVAAETEAGADAQMEDGGSPADAAMADAAAE